MQQTIKSYIDEITVDSKCSLNDLLAAFYREAGMHISFENITEAEKAELHKLTREMDMHESFVRHFLENFHEKITPLGLFEVAKHIDTVAETTNVRIGLEKLYRHPHVSDNAKNYIKVWLIQPLQVMGKIADFLSEMMFDDEQIFNVAIKDKHLFNKAAKKALIHPEDFNLVSFIVFNENAIPSRVHSRTEEVLALDIAGCASLSDIRERIGSIKMEDFMGPSSGLDGLRTATDCLLKIHHAYPTMQANMINYSTHSIGSSLMGGARLPSEKVIKLYAGEYEGLENEIDGMPESGSEEFEPFAEQSAVRGLITNPEGFNALSASARKTVARYLPATRKQFNQIVVNAINSVHTWMPQLINARTSNHELNRVISGLAKSYNSISGGQQGMVDWFMHKFAPAVNAYRSRAMAPTGIAVVDNVFGGSPVNSSGRLYGSGMSGGARRNIVNRDMEAPSSRVVGGGVIGDYYDGIKRAQSKFNDQFDDIYRKLTAAVRNVADKQQFTSEQNINRVIEALMSITLSSRKTVMKISGLTPKLDLNTRYTSMVEHVIKTIDNTKISGFGEVTSVLRSLVSLLKNVKQEGMRLIKMVSEGTKSSEEIVRFISFEREDMLSGLTTRELHALVESINALVFANRGHSLTTKIEQHRDADVKEYIKKVTNRSEAINDYYENMKLRWLKYNRNVDSDTHSFIKTHIKAVASAMVYINEKVDTKLMEWRQKMAKGGNVTKKQIDDIENLTMTYMHYRPGEKLLQIFSKLEKLRQETGDRITIGELYKITDVINKIVMNAGYVEMIQNLYKILEIDDGHFDWNAFKLNVTKLLVEKLVAIDDQWFGFNINETPAARNTLIEPDGNDTRGFSTGHYYKFLRALNGKLAGNCTGEWGYNKFFNLIVAAFTPIGNNRMSAVHSGLGSDDIVELRVGYAMKTREVMLGFAPAPAIERFSGDNRIIPVPSYTIHNGVYTENANRAVKDMLNRIGYGDERINDLWDLNNIDDADDVHQIIRIKLAMLDHITMNLANNKVNELYSVAQLREFVDILYGAFMYNPGNGNELRNSHAILHVYSGGNIAITWDGYFGVSRETATIVDIFHAMIANVLYTFNRYIAIRYTGSSNALPVPIMSSAMLGGDLEGTQGASVKMEAGSAIDVIGTHDLKFDKVIPEAVPFYAIALDIFHTFMTEVYSRYNHENREEEPAKIPYGDSAFGIYVTISEFSILHQLYEVIRDYTIVGDVRRDPAEALNHVRAPLTEVQLKMIIAELNKIWNLVSGSGKEKLMNAIDYVIGDINASILFTSRNRFEELKRNGSTEFDVSTKVEQQFAGLITELQRVITDNINVVTTLNPEAMGEFENFLKNSVERVSKESNEIARLNYVREIINDESTTYKTPYEDYYKFCEFIITPIMIAAKSYSEVFRLINTVAVGGGRFDNTAIDLTNIKIALRREDAPYAFHAAANIADITDDASVVSVDAICRAARSGEPLTGIYLAGAVSLVGSPIVAQYNTAIIHQALQKAILNNTAFVMPTVWLPLVPETYPDAAHYSISPAIIDAAHVADTRDRLSANIALYELYPNIKSNRLIDFVNVILSDFSSDMDHLLHAFMTYPGISDRFLSQLKSIHESASTSLKSMFKEELWENGNHLINDIRDKKLSTVPMAVTPLYPDNLNIQAYTGTVNIPAISLQKTGNASTNSYTILGTGQTAYSYSISTKVNNEAPGSRMCQYGLVDWLIYKLAACNTIGYTLPVMLYEMLKTNSILGRVLVECAIDGNRVVYTPHSSGYIFNIITQNILTRSATDRNRQESAAMNNMNKSWIANLVATIPGLIAHVKAISKITDKGVADYNGINIDQLCITMVTILESFYEECVPHMPFVPFLSDYIPGTFHSAIERKLSKFHPIAEIYYAMHNPVAELDSLKYEWANRPYYANGLQIPFPEYKNRDKFESLKKWGGSLFQNSLFDQEFSGTMEIIGRSIIRHKTIKRNASMTVDNIVRDNANLNIDNRELVELCITIIHEAYEIDPTVIEIFINNIIREARSVGQAMLGGGVTYRDDAPNSEALLNSDNGKRYAAALKKLLNGIFAFNESDLVVGPDAIAENQGLKEYANAALSLLYDNPNVRPLYTFRNANDAGKELYSSGANLLLRDISSSDILGALKTAATPGKINIDATTRAKQFLAYTAINLKHGASIDARMPAYNAYGTLEMAAKYATSEKKPDETIRGFMDNLAVNNVYDPSEEFQRQVQNEYNNKVQISNANIPDCRILQHLISGYGNMTRLAIASNALYALSTHVARLFDVKYDPLDNGIQTASILVTFADWMSLKGADTRLPRINAVDPANPRVGGLVRHDRLCEGGDQFELDISSLHADHGVVEGISSQPQRRMIQRCIRALEKSMNANDAGLGLGARLVNCVHYLGIGIDGGLPEVDADLDRADIRPLIGKLFPGDIAENGILRLLLTPTASTAPGANDRLFSTVPAVGINRAAIVYVLFTRFGGEVFDMLEDDINNTFLSTVAQWFGLNIAEFTREKCIALMQFIALLIEFYFRTTNGRMAAPLTNIFAPSIRGYMHAISEGNALRRADENCSLINGDTFANWIDNGKKLAPLCMNLLDLFFGGSNEAIMTALTKYRNNNDLLNRAGTYKNGNMWVFALKHCRSYELFNSDVNQYVRDTFHYPEQLYEGIPFVPLSKSSTDGRFELIKFNNITLFGKSYDINIPEADIGFGFGKAPAVLRAISAAAAGEHDPSFLDNTNRDLPIYGTRDMNAVNPTGLVQTADTFMDWLRLMGVTAIVRSPSYNVRFNGEGADSFNMLAIAFRWRSNVVGVDGYDITNENIQKLRFIDGVNRDQENVSRVLANFAFTFGVNTAYNTNINVYNSIENNNINTAICTTGGQYELSRYVQLLFKQIKSRCLSTVMYEIDRIRINNYRARAIRVNHRELIPETHVRLNKIPTIIPRIHPREMLSISSVMIQTFIPRSVGEYMLWNPGYELFNLLVPRHDQLNAPFAVIVQPAYYNVNKIIPSFMINPTCNSFGLSKRNIAYVPGAAIDIYRFAWWIRDEPYITRAVQYESDDAISHPIINYDQIGLEDANAANLVNRLTHILNKWCDDICNKANNIPQTDGWSLNMMGGAIEFETYIDVSKVSAGEPYLIYPSIYPAARNADDDIAPGLAFYGKIFKKLSHTVAGIGSLALAYFNRSLLTFSGVLSNFVYPNAIYGKSLFDKFTECLGNAFQGISRNVHDARHRHHYSDEENNKKRWDFYTFFAENFAKRVNGTILNASERALYPLNQCNVDDSRGSRDSGIRKFDDMSIIKLSERFTHGFGGRNATANAQSMFSSEFTTPSICNSFLTILHNLIIGKINARENNTTNDNLAKMQWFIGTETMGALRSIDSLLTYTSVIASLIKQLSFYDLDDDTERTYIARDPAEPYMGVQPEDSF